MPDGNDKGGGAATPTPEELQGELAKLKSQLDAALKERDDFQTKFDDAKKTRDAAKAKEREEAEKRGEWDKVKSTLESELADAKARVAELEPLKTRYEETQKSLTAIVEAQKKELLERLPEAERKEWEGESLESIRKAVKLLPEAERVNTTGKASTPGGGGEAKKWSEMSLEEKNRFMESHTNEEIVRKKLA